MARIVPDMVRLGSLRSVYGFVSSFMKDERLRTIFSFHPLLVGGNPFTATSIYCADLPSSSGAGACISPWGAPAGWSRASPG